MQNFYYAIINSDNICEGISNLSGEINSDNMIRILDYDTSLLGKKYNNGEWIEVEKEPYLIPLSEMEQSIQETAINTEYLVALTDLGL